VSSCIDTSTHRLGLKRTALFAMIATATLFAVFVASARAELVRPFLPSASLNGSDTPGGEFNTPCGDAVDSHGDIYVANFGSNTIDIFGPSGSFITAIVDQGGGPCGLAVDSVGTVYTFEFDQLQRTVKFTPSSFPPTAATTYSAATPLAESSGTASVAVNPDNDHVLIAVPGGAEHLTEYKSAAEGSGIITESLGGSVLATAHMGQFSEVEIDGTTEDIYVGGVSFTSGTPGQVAILSPDGSSLLQQIDGAGSPQGGFNLQSESLAVDSSNGDVLIADLRAHGVIQEYTASGTFVDDLGPTFGGTEVFQYAEPSDVAVAPPGTPNAGNVYVTSGASGGGNVFAFGALQGPKELLTVTKSGSGTGTVTSDIGGVNCGSACSGEFEEGEEVTLSAAADANSEFKGWSGACTGLGTCTGTMAEAETVNAEFVLKAPTTFALSITKSGSGAGTVTSTPPGIDCGGACSSQFSSSSSVTLTATAAGGSQFKGWSGACTGIGSCTVSMSAAQSLNAEFDSVPSGGGGPGPGPGGPALTCATDPALCPASIASVAGKAAVSGGKASMKVSCPGPGSCSGSFKLTAKVTTGKGKKTKQMVVGKASFSLAPGTFNTLRVSLNGTAKQILASGKQLRASVIGAGVKSGSVTLKGMSGKPKKKKG
jgi:Divergent InlB B-repeat domain